MPQIDLKLYTEEVARKIENGQVDAAIDHCRHMLEFYPRYLSVYRLLASASLEKGDYAHAAHFLQSLLSADPERADAWADLATLSDDLGELEQATWLMERAFEIEPGNAEIRERLRDLYKRRDGIDRPRLKLTAGALGRMYAVGGFYRRAIHELQRVLESRAGLPPLHVAFLEVALVRALWNADNMQDMAESVCHSLLGKLPNCLHANLIMGQILWSRGQAEEAEKYLTVARALDPEGRAAQDLFGDQSPIPYERIQIPHLEAGEEVTVIEQQPVPAQPVEDTSWLDHVGEAFDAGFDVTALSEPEAEPQTPDWLGEWSAAEVSAAEADSPVAPPAEREEVGQTAPLPAWMAEVEPEEAEGEAQDAELPAWLEEEASAEDQLVDLAVGEARLSPSGAEEGEEEEEEETAELPAWLEELAAEAEPAEEVEALSEEEAASRASPEQPETTSDEGVEAPKETAGELSADELPDWLRAFDEPDLEEPAEIESRAPQSQTFDEELPDWMQTSTVEAAEPASEDVGEEDELPDWLRALGDADEQVADLTSAEGASPETAPGAALDEEELPDWLRELRAQQPDLEEEQDTLEWMADESREAEGELETIEEDELPDWLRELRSQEQPDESLPIEYDTPEPEQSTETTRATESSDEVESLRDDELPEWLQELRAQEPMPIEEIQEPEELSVESELPDWLEQIESETSPEIPVESLDEEELPDWLRELRAQEPAFVDEEEEQTLIAPPAEQAPDWLAEIQAEELTEPPIKAVDEEELPDWLRELRAQEPGFLSGEEDSGGLLAALGEGEATARPSEGEPEVGLEAELPVEAIEEEALPDWLRALRAEEAPQVTAVSPPEPTLPAETLAAAESPETAPVEAGRRAVEMPEPVDGMPSWLSELEAEIAAQHVPEPEVEQPAAAGDLADAHQEGAARIGADEVEAAQAGELEVRKTEELEIPEAVAIGEPEAEPAASDEQAISAETVSAVEAAEEPTETVAEVEAEGVAVDETIEAQAPEPVVEVPAWIEPEETRAPEEAIAPDVAWELEAEGPEMAVAPEVELRPADELTDAQIGAPAAELAEPGEGSGQMVADEEPDWVRELEAPIVSPELEISPEGPDLAQLEEAAAAPPTETAEVGVGEPEAAPALAEVTQPAQRLAQARSSLADGALDAAAGGYEQLVDMPSLQPDLLQDLEQAVQVHPDHAALQRVLGDVYMRVGQPRKALQAYQQALRSLA